MSQKAMLRSRIGEHPALAPAAAVGSGGAVRQRQRRQQRQPPAALSAQPRSPSPGPGPSGRSHHHVMQPQRAAAVDVALGSVEIESLTYHDGCFSVQGCLLSAAPPEIVYQVLTDYDSLPRVFSNVETSALRHTECGQKQLVQTCKWAFLVFSGTFVNELNVQEDPATRQVTFSLIQSAFMREFVGSWHIRRVPGSNMTEVRHRLAVRPTVAPPQKVGDLSKKIFKKQVSGILDDLAQELDRHMA